MIDIVKSYPKFTQSYQQLLMVYREIEHGTIGSKGASVNEESEELRDVFSIGII